MTKFYTLLILLLIGNYLVAQQTFTNLQDASMVIGQPRFDTLYNTSNDSITRAPSYCSVSSKGMLAVADQLGSSLKIWHHLPTRNGQPADVSIKFSLCNGVAWSPDGNKLVATGNNDSILIWNSVPTVNNQPADVKITLYTNFPVGALITPDGRLFVGEFDNNRILAWKSIPTADNTPADYVIGQLDMTTTSAGTADYKLFEPWGMSLSPDGRFLVADRGNNRVLVFDSVPVASGESATVVIGQTGFGMNSAGLSESKFNLPHSVTVTVDGKVAVAEYTNNRVLIFDSIPESNGEKATFVLGQPDFTTNTAFYPSGDPAANNIKSAYSISADLNGRLFICGREMRRTMVFGELPEENADLSISLAQSFTDLCDSSQVTYHVKILNNGPDPGYSIVATTAFPDGYSLDNFTSTKGVYTRSSGYWKIPFIASGDSADITITGYINAGMSGKTTITYANIISSSAFDPDLSNNGTSVTSTISVNTKPADPDTESDVITCSGSTATLTATGDGDLFWYENIDDVVPFATGSTCITKTIISPTTYYVQANNGCPSRNRVPVNISVLPSYSDTTKASICNGENYMFYGQSYTEDGTYSKSYQSIDGCDSVKVLKLTVNPTYNDTTAASICDGGSYSFESEDYTQAGTYTKTYQTVNGCDSVKVLKLTVNPTYNDTIDITICKGEDYTFDSEDFTEAGTYTKTYQTINGCDSLVTLNLSVFEVNTDVSHNDNVLTADATTGAYQWINCSDNSLLAGETGQSFTASQNGEYAVIITQNNCVNTSQCYNIINTGIDGKNSDLGISVFPNPARDIVVLEFNEQYEKISLVLLNVKGQELIHSQYTGEKHIELNIGNLKEGIYFLHVYTLQKNSWIRIVKQQ